MKLSQNWLGNSVFGVKFVWCRVQNIWVFFIGWGGRDQTLRMVLDKYLSRCRYIRQQQLSFAQNLRLYHLFAIPIVTYVAQAFHDFYGILGQTERQGLQLISGGPYQWLPAVMFHELH